MTETKPAPAARPTFAGGNAVAALDIAARGVANATAPLPHHRIAFSRPPDVQKDSGGPKTATPPPPIGAESSILEILERPVSSRDVHALQERVRNLLVVFAALPSLDRRALLARLRDHRHDDKLAAAFRYRLSTPTRDSLIHALDGEPTPLPAAHHSIEPDAFVTSLDDASIKIDPDPPRLSGYEETLVNAQLTSALSPAEGYTTEVAYHVAAGGAKEYASGKVPWPAGVHAPLDIGLLEVMGGRTSLSVEIIVDGTVRRVLRRLIEVGPGASPGEKTIPDGVRELVRSLIAKPIRVDKRGEADDDQIAEIHRQLAAIMPIYRAALVTELSAPPKSGSLASLFLANVPAVERPRLIATLTRGVEASPDAVDARVTAQPFELSVTPQPLVITPWSHGEGRVKVRPKDSTAFTVDDPALGPELEIYWDVTDEDGLPVSEHRTTWRLGTPEGPPLDLPLRAAGTFHVTAHIGQKGVVGQSVSTDVNVIVERENALTAAQAMDPAQAFAERAQLREQMAGGDAATNADLWMRASVLDARIAASGAKEQPPKVADSEVFAADSWINHTGPGVNRPLSTNRVHLRFLIEQRFQGPMDESPPISTALQAYINDPHTEEENRTRAQQILGLVRAEEAAIEREATAFQKAFGRKGRQVCLQILDDGKRDVEARQREYGLVGPAGRSVPDNIEALAEAANELLPLQSAIHRAEDKVADLERQMKAFQHTANDPSVGEDAQVKALEQGEALRNVLAVEMDGVVDAENAFQERKTELQLQFPILAVANFETYDKKKRLDKSILRQLAKGELGRVAAKLAKVLSEIEKVRGEIDDESVWSIPDLLAITRSTIGLTPGTFENWAVDLKLREIAFGKKLKLVSAAAQLLLAFLLPGEGLIAIAFNTGMAIESGIELYYSIKEFQLEKALHGTHYDQAKALSQEDPSYFWLALNIVMTVVGTRATIKELNQARKAYSAIRGAARAAEAIEHAGHIESKLLELEQAAKANGVSDAARGRLRAEALDVLAGRGGEIGATARKMLSGSEDLAKKAGELTGAVKEHVTTLGGKDVPEFNVEVLSKSEFEARFGSKRGRAVFTMSEGKPTIFARLDTRPQELADEAAHLVQLSDPKLASDLKYLDEANLADWNKMSVSDKMEFYQRKLNVEIDAKQRTIAKIKDPDELAVAQANLEQLQALQRRVGSITDDQIAQMNAKVLREPDFLDQPARAFRKDKVPVGQATPHPATVEPNPNAPTPREVSTNKANADYSTAYNDSEVVKVTQHGETWQEHVIVTSGYEGKITSVKTNKDGSIVVSVKDSGSSKLQTYTIEAGARLEPNIKTGETILKDARIAFEKPRDYRWVEIENADGTKVVRAEIKSAKRGVGWVPRGREATARGTAAEAHAMAEADVALAAAKKAGEISGSVHIPNKVGGGGFDDVIVEFHGTGDDLTATIRIREVKDYPNRHVPLAEFTAINENWEKNLRRLKDHVDEAVAGKPPAGLEKLTEGELQAIQRKLKADDFKVEIRLGEKTSLGAAGHYASSTVPALEKRVGRKIDVKKIGEGDRTP